MLIGRKLGGFSPQKPKKTENYVQEEFYCEMCGRTTKEETILEEKLGKYLGNVWRMGITGENFQKIFQKFFS